MPAAFPVLFIAEADPEMAVMGSGVLDHLAEALPQARFTVVGSPTSAPLFAGVPRLDRTLILKGEGLAELTGLWNQVRGTHWGLVVDMRGTKLSGWLRRQKRAVRGEMPDGLHAVEAAARVLYVHHNKDRYRLRKVAEVTGWDPLDPREGNVLQTALALGRLDGTPRGVPGTSTDAVPAPL